jgi:hypothetical protein
MRKNYLWILFYIGFSIVLFIPSFLILSSLYNSKDPEWMITWGSENNEEWGHDLVIDSNDNLYVVGDTETYGAGDEDVVLIKFDDLGKVLWYKTWGGTEFDNGYGIISDSLDNLYLTGTTQSFGQGKDDIILLKYSNDGVLLFNETWGNNKSDIGYDLLTDSKGDIYITGETRKDGALYSDIVLIKFNSTGSEIWNATWGGIYNDRCSGIAIDSNGDIYVVGSSVIYNIDYIPTLVILKYNSSGNLLWNLTWGQEFGAMASEIVIDSKDYIYLIGNAKYDDFSSYQELLIMKLNDQQILWSKMFSGRGHDIELTSDQKIYILGGKGQGYTSNSIVLYQFDSNGNQQAYYSHDVDYAYYEYGVSITFDSKNNFYIIGYFHTIENQKDSILLIKNLSLYYDLSLIFSISIPILISIEIQLSYLTIIKKNKALLKLERMDDSLQFPLPLEIKGNFSENEILLHKTKIKYIQQAGFILFFGGIVIPVASGFIISVSGWPNTNNLSGALFIFFPLTMGLIFFISLFVLIKVSLIREKLLVITNKNIFYKEMQNLLVNVKSLEINHIKSVIFKEYHFKRAKDIGSIAFIPDKKYDESSIILVNNIPQFSMIQRRIESIIYHYTNIEERLNELQNQLKITLPQKIKISEELAKELLKLCILFIISSIVSIIFFILLGIFLYNLFLGDLYYFISYLLSIIVYVVVFLVRIISKIIYYIQAILHQNRELKIGVKNIECSYKKYSNSIPFDSKISLNYLWIKKFFSKTAKWSHADGVIIYSPTTKKRIKFGPIDNYSEYFEFIYCNIITWKAENNLLLTKDEILAIKEEDLSIPFSPKYKLTLAPLDESNMIYQQYKAQLKPKERIYISFKPISKIGFYDILPIIILGFFIIGSYLLLTFFKLDNIFSILIQSFNIVFFIFIIIYPVSKIYFNIQRKNYLYVITDQKIIFETNFAYKIVQFENISNIFPISHKRKKRYDIIIKLKSLDSKTPFNRRQKIKFSNLGNFFGIIGVPLNDNLLDKLKFLINKNRFERT